MRGRGLAWAWALVLLPALAVAQRPDEADLFGAPAETPDAGTGAGDAGAPGTQGEQPKPPVDNRDAEALTQGAIKDAFAPGGEAVEDPLKIGGRFYLQAGFSGGYGRDVRDARFSSPTLVDGYFDARPNDRIRGMLAARLTFDASAAQGITEAPASRVERDLTLVLEQAESRNPNVLLDQAWLRFDIERAVFLTVGRQHVKWGTGRIWNPTDYLTAARRDPLAFIDTRLGTSMVKVHVPWESAAANFYGYGLLDVDGPAGILRQIGGAARAELVVLKTAEVGLGAVVQRGRQPRFALDISTPLGPVDVYGELALKRGEDDPPKVRECGDTCPLTPVRLTVAGAPLNVEVDTGYELYYQEGWTPGATAGVEWTFAYADNETATVGAEYFYNSGGYTDPALYSALLLGGLLSPFYMGQHYAALYATVIGPGSWDKTAFLLFNLANLSDRSFVSRLNFSVQVMTYLTVEAYGAVHYGNPNGVFRLGMQVDPIPVLLPEGLNLPAALWDVGMGLRVSL